MKKWPHFGESLRSFDKHVNDILQRYPSVGTLLKEYALHTESNYKQNDPLYKKAVEKAIDLGIANYGTINVENYKVFVADPVLRPLLTLAAHPDKIIESTLVDEIIYSQYFHMTGLPEKKDELLPVSIISKWEDNFAKIKHSGNLDTKETPEDMLKDCNFVNSTNGAAYLAKVITKQGYKLYLTSALPVENALIEIRETASEWYKAAVFAVKDITIKSVWELAPIAWDAAPNSVKLAHIKAVRELARKVWDYHLSTSKTEIKTPLPKSVTPFKSNGMSPIATGFPALGLTNAIMQAAKGWAVDYDDCPRFVQKSDTHKMIYYIIQPLNDNADTFEIAQKELAWQILKSMGIDTAWLHMLLLAYAARPELAKGGGESIIPKEDVYRILNLDRKFTIDGKRRMLSAEEKDERAFAEVSKLKSIGLQMAKVDFTKTKKNGKKTEQYFNIEGDNEVNPFWLLNVYAFGQGKIVYDESTGETKTSLKYDNWQLISRAGLWGNKFLYGEPKRYFGWLSYDMLTKIDRNRAPWSASLAVQLTFKSRMSLGAPVSISNSEIINFAGGELDPDRRTKHDYRKQLCNAIEEQRKWGCIPDYSDWPEYLRPQPENLDQVDDSILRGDGSAACPQVKRLPNNYWSELINSKTVFKMPTAIQSALISGRENIQLPQAKQQWTGSRVKELRLKLQWTQGQLAEYLGVSKGQIQHYEAGRRDVTTAHKKSLEKLERAETSA